MEIKKTVSAADANRMFSQILRSVRQGRSYVVTSHGQPVAKISPVDEPGKIEASARNALLVRLRRQSVANADRWTREELYEDAQ